MPREYDLDSSGWIVTSLIIGVIGLIVLTVTHLIRLQAVSSFMITPTILSAILISGLALGIGLQISLLVGILLVWSSFLIFLSFAEMSISFRPLKLLKIVFLLALGLFSG